MKFLIFGTGDYYERYKKWFPSKDVLALLDNSEKKQNTQIDGIPVLAPEEGVKLPYDVIVILSFYVKEMRQQLYRLGVPEERICHFYDLHGLICREDKKKPEIFWGGARELTEDKARLKETILLLSQDLELGGPALALFYAAKALKKQGRRVLLASMIDGKLKERLLKEEIPVIVDANLQIGTMKDITWIRDFSLIICNTINYHVFLSKRDSEIPVIWWLHDSPFFYHGVRKEILESIDRTNLLVCSVGPVPEKAIHRFLPDLKIKKQLYGVEDTGSASRRDRPKDSKGGGSIHFVTIGYIESRKGQDILIQAVLSLPKSLKKRAKFSLIGQNSSAFAQDLMEITKDIPEVEITGPVDRDKINEILENADVLICPSREDPMPTVCAEAMMHQVPCLVSDAAGTAGYIEDGENGLVFSCGDFKALRKKIEWCISHYEELAVMGKNARKLYDKHFSMEVFEKGWKEMADSLLSVGREPFQKYRSVPVALYGLSKETEKALEELKGRFRIVGLLDSFQEEGTFYGKPVISLESCIDQGVKLIIVVARPGSCKAIAKKIGSFCMENKIALMDIRGKDLHRQNEIVYDLKNLDGYTREELMGRCMEADIISLDLFDTLVMRRVLFSADVIELTEKRLEEKQVFLQDFCAKRLGAEKKLSQIGAPSLTEIYENVLEKSDKIPLTARELADLEWQIDFDLIVPRQDMTELVSELTEKGKEVCIITDTYYTGEQIREILKKCGIRGLTGVFVSSEYGIGKTQGLFEIFRKRTGEKKRLHIGDDLTADIEYAKRTQIEAFRILSAQELLENLGFLGFEKHMDSLSARIKLGLFAAKLFNSPFQFETLEKKLCINSAFDLGYLLIAPVVTDFVVWLAEKLRSEPVSNMWFGARDGYLIKILYDRLVGENKSVYFLTSRAAAVRAGVENIEDLRHIAEMKFSGTVKEQLKERFGIEISEEESGARDLTQYSRQILSQALIYKRNYQKYIASLNPGDEDLGFFDFVAKGTTQMYCSRLVSNHLKGFYFLQLEKGFARDRSLDIQAFYDSEKEESRSIFDNYYILETILTSPMPSVTGFDENGEACYGKESRSRRGIECFQRVQAGIKEFFETFLEICPESSRDSSKKADEVFLELIHHVRISEGDFMKLEVEDPFFNRLTEMEALI